MKIILSFIFCSLLGTLFAQNYQTIKSNQINYFGISDLDYILATRTDSIHVVDGDSIFYSYRTARNNDLGESCLLTISAPWTGEKIIIEEEGRNVFFNEALDSIFIDPLATLNDTFLVYTYPTGEWVKGTVSDLSEETILGSLDSIKTIDLFSNNLDFNLETPQLKIGKINGFIEVFPFFSFPNEYVTQVEFSVGTFLNPLTLIGSEFPRIGITKPRVGEIYKHEIGDEINYTSIITYFPEYNYERNTVELDFLDKTSWGFDSVEYVISSKVEYRFQYTEFPEMNTLSIGSSEITVRYYDLEEQMNPYLPEEFIFNNESESDWIGSAQWNIMYAPYCGRISEAVRKVGTLMYATESELDSTSLCLAVYSLGNSDYYQNYTHGAGGGYFNSGFIYDGYGQAHSGNIGWISNADGDCGTNYFVNIDENESQNLNIKVFPNPAKDHVTIAMNDALIDGLAVFSTDGKLVYENKQVGSNTVDIDCSHLTAGIYLVQVNIEDETIRQKLIIQ